MHGGAGRGCHPPGYPTRRFRRGFTLLELVVVITIIVVVMGIFLSRMAYYQEQAEKTAMESVVGVIQTALTLQYAQIMTRGKPSDMDMLSQDNPMDWLQRKPRNYAGEFYDPLPSSVERGNWMFDLKSRELIYVPRNADYLRSTRNGRKWIRFHVVLVYESPRVPSLRNAPKELTGALVEPVEPYSWF